MYARTEFNRLLTDFESVRGAGYTRNRFRADAIVVGVIHEGQVESKCDRNPN